MFLSKHTRAICSKQTLLAYSGKLLNFILDLESCVGSRNPFLSDPITSFVAFTALSFFFPCWIQFKLNVTFKKKVWIGMTCYFFGLNFDSSRLIYVSFSPPKESSILFELKIVHLKLHAHSLLSIKNKNIITVGFSIRMYLKLFSQVPKQLS